MLNCPGIDPGWTLHHSAGTISDTFRLNTAMNSRCSIAVIATGCLVYAPLASGAFNTIVNSPPDYIAPESVFESDTQINIHPERLLVVGEVLSLGELGSSVENTRLNLIGGAVWSVNAWPGSQIDVQDGFLFAGNLLGARGSMSGGFVSNWSVFAESELEISGGRVRLIETAGFSEGPRPKAATLAMRGGEVDILDATGDVSVFGGAIQKFTFRGGGHVDVRGGTIGDDFEVGNLVARTLSNEPTIEMPVSRRGTLSVTGGLIGRRLTIREGRTLDYAGGVIGDGIQVLDGSRVVIRGASFLLDGVELDAHAGQQLELIRRDVELEELLADGQSFRFYLGSEPGRGDYFSPDATVILLVVPEPQTDLLLVVLAIAVVLGSRRACRPTS